jgi:hypothetical protein
MTEMPAMPLWEILSLNGISLVLGGYLVGMLDGALDGALDKAMEAALAEAFPAPGHAGGLPELTDPYAGV